MYLARKIPVEWEENVFFLGATTRVNDVMRFDCLFMHAAPLITALNN